MLDILLDDNYKKSEDCQDDFDVFKTQLKPEILQKTFEKLDKTQKEAIWNACIRSMTLIQTIPGP